MLTVLAGGRIYHHQDNNFTSMVVRSLASVRTSESGVIETIDTLPILRIRPFFDGDFYFQRIVQNGDEDRKTGGMPGLVPEWKQIDYLCEELNDQYIRSRRSVPNVVEALWELWTEPQSGIDPFVSEYRLREIFERFDDFVAWMVDYFREPPTPFRHGIQSICNQIKMRAVVVKQRILSLATGSATEEDGRDNFGDSVPLADGVSFRCSNMMTDPSRWHVVSSTDNSTGLLTAFRVRSQVSSESCYTTGIIEDLGMKKLNEQILAELCKVSSFDGGPRGDFRDWTPSIVGIGSVSGSDTNTSQGSLAPMAMTCLSR